MFNVWGNTCLYFKKNTIIRVLLREVSTLILS